MNEFVNSIVANNLPPIRTFSIPSAGWRKLYVTSPLFACTMRTFLLNNSNASWSVVRCNKIQNSKTKRKSILPAIDCICKEVIHYGGTAHTVPATSTTINQNNDIMQMQKLMNAMLSAINVLQH